MLNGVGAPLQRILSTPAVSELSKVISNAQWPDEMTQQVLMVRSSLERRIAVGVFGSAATDLDADQRKCFAHLRQGHLGRARPSLLVKGAGASTQADPLSFLLKLESGQQEAALCGAFLLMIAALQVAFPAQAATSMRFMGKVQRWIHEQRGAGASWTALSAWYAGLCKRADRRVEKVLQRTADTLSTLDTAWIGDAGADYNAAYNVARAPELAASAAAKQRESDEQKRPKRDRVTPPPKPKKKAASGKSGGGGGGSSSGGGGGGSCGGGGGGGTYRRMDRREALQIPLDNSAAIFVEAKVIKVTIALASCDLEDTDLPAPLDPAQRPPSHRKRVISQDGILFPLFVALPFSHSTHTQHAGHGICAGRQRHHGSGRLRLRHIVTRVHVVCSEEPCAPVFVRFL